MPKRTKAQRQAERAEEMLHLFIASSVMDDDRATDSDAESESESEGEAGDGDGAADVLLLVAMEVMDEIVEMNDTSRGRYGLISKSKDWFPMALMSPDRYFRYTFRYECAFIFD